MNFTQKKDLLDFNDLRDLAQGKIRIVLFSYRESPRRFEPKTVGSRRHV